MANETKDDQPLPTPAHIHLPEGTWTLEVTGPDGSTQQVTSVKGPGLVTIAVKA